MPAHYFHPFLKSDDFVKSPDASLRSILRHCDILPGMSQTSGRGLARLACGTFYEAAQDAIFFDLLRVHQF
jgi:hypothetical protein